MSLADELDELDPDFNHQFTENDDLDSLGSSFGNPINQHNSFSDDDEEDGDAAYQASLRALHSQFKVDDGMPSSLADLSSSSADSDLAGGQWGNPVAAGSNSSAVHSTPPKHHRGNSLAFELASASKPTKGASRDLLRELGIEEDEDGEDGAGHDSREFESEDEDQFSHFGSSAPQPSLAPDASPSLVRQISRLSLGPNTSPPATPSMRRGGSAMQREVSQDFGTNEEDDERHAEEIDKLQAQTAAQMADSLGLTTSFLRKLTSHTTTVDAGNTSSRLPSSFASPTLNATTPTTPTAGPRSASAATGDDSGPSDRQQIVEQLAGGVIKTMYELVRQREAMNRELAEVERQVMKGGAGWMAALAGTEELPEAEVYVEEGPLAPIAAEKVQVDSEDDEFAQANGAEPTRATSASPALSSLSHLKSTTTSLLSTLSTLHESSQVSLAAASDSSRKLRALRGQLQAAQDDWASSSKAEQFVRDFEESAQSGRERGWRAKEAGRIREEVERGLEDGWRKAREVLVSAA